MDEIESKPAQLEQLAGWQDHYDSLRNLIVSVIVLVIVLSGTVNIYLLRQARYASYDLKAIRPQFAQMVAEYQRQEPAFRDFVNKLNEYGRTHPDFVPILNKYNIRAPGAVPASTATGAPPAVAKP